MEARGSSVLVTGAAGGLGRTICRTLHREGAQVVVSGRDRVALEALAEEVDAEVAPADLRVPEQVRALAARASTCDVLVANAAVGREPAWTELDDQAVDEHLDVNLRAPISLSLAFARAKVASGRAGRIVIIGSLSGMVALPGTRMYTASKFGLRGFALGLAQDLAGTGVTCTLVAPGMVRDAGMFHDRGLQLPRGVRTCSPDEVAAAVVDAIHHPRAEVLVAPAELRVLARLGAVAPRAVAAVRRRTGTAFDVTGVRDGASERGAAPPAT